MPPKRRRDAPLPRRSSTIVGRKALQGVRAREELTRLLRAHDPETAAESAQRITTEHLPLLRQMASETPVSNVDPALRRHAVAALGRLTDAENLNLLADLGQFDPDPGVRAAALVSLGTTGVRLVTPLLAAGLTAADPVEAMAARKAIQALATKIGPGAVRLSLGKPDRATAARVKLALVPPTRPRRAKRSHTQGD